MTRPTGSALLARGVQQLRDAGVPDPAVDARRLFSHALNIAPGRLTLTLPEPAGEAAEAVFAVLIQRRCAREPVSHLIGARDFYGRSFKVTRDVLDPRPDTETLVEVALRQPFERVLDLGTGSGCILLTLLLETPLARGLGVDLSPEAITVAQENSAALGLTDRARFQVSNWTTSVDETYYDLIVSNPPYIAPSEMAGLAPEVRDWEPHLALTDGLDGLESYRRICAEAPLYLRRSGRLLVEIGPTQGRAVRDLFRQNGLIDIEVIPDLDGRDRVVAGVWPKDGSDDLPF